MNSRSVFMSPSLTKHMQTNMRPSYAKFLNDDYIISIYYYTDKFRQTNRSFLLLLCNPKMFKRFFFIHILASDQNRQLYLLKEQVWIIISKKVLSWKVLGNTCHIHRCNQATCQPLQLPDRFESRFLDIFDVRHNVAGHQLRASPRPVPLLHAIQ